MSDSSSDEEVEMTTQSKPAPPKGVSGLSGLTGLSGNKSKIEEEESIQTEDTTIIFELPSGEKKKHKVSMAKAVESLKVLVEKEYGIGFDTQEMFSNGVELQNFLSLLDIPSIKPNQENVIVVKTKA